MYNCVNSGSTGFYYVRSIEMEHLQLICNFLLSIERIKKMKATERYNGRNGININLIVRIVIFAEFIGYRHEIEKFHITKLINCMVTWM